MTEQQPPPPPGCGTPPQGYGTPPTGGYPPPGYGQGQWPYAPQRQTNVLAIVSLVAIFVFAPAALVLGILARKEIARTGEAGDGMALAGIIVGGIATAFFVLFLTVFVSALVLST